MKHGNITQSPERQVAGAVVCRFGLRSVATLYRTKQPYHVRVGGRTYTAEDTDKLADKLAERFLENKALYVQAMDMLQA